jgi:hypothetical protein
MKDRKQLNTPYDDTNSRVDKHDGNKIQARLVRKSSKMLIN